MPGKILALVVAALVGFWVPAHAETASEVPLENPEILKPDPRPKGGEINPGQDKGVTENGSAQQKQAMTLGRMQEIVKALDPDAQMVVNQMRLKISDVPVMIIVDPIANRMRALTPIKSLDGVGQRELYRLMQANYDSALDARYAIAREYILSVFIHPLAELEKDQFIEGLGQVVNLVKTYGTAYTSGAITFGGGDSRKLHRKLIDELLKKGENI